MNNRDFMYQCVQYTVNMISCKAVTLSLNPFYSQELNIDSPYCLHTFLLKYAWRT